MFGDINLKAEIVNGTCPTCSQNTLLVSLTPELTDALHVVPI